jgi:hypothetical protein
MFELWWDVAKYTILPLEVTITYSKLDSIAIRTLQMFASSQNNQNRKYQTRKEIHQIHFRRRHVTKLTLNLASLITSPPPLSHHASISFLFSNFPCSQLLLKNSSEYSSFKFLELVNCEFCLPSTSVGRYRRLQCGTADNGFWRLISFLPHFLFPIASIQGPYPHLPSLSYPFRASRQPP